MTVSQRRLGQKLGVSRMSRFRQILKINSYCYKREKTPKYSEEIKKNCAKNWPTCCLFLGEEKFFTYGGSNMF